MGFLRVFGPVRVACTYPDNLFIYGFLAEEWGHGDKDSDHRAGDYGPPDA